MFWIIRFFRRPTHEPEVLESQREQIRKFDAWASTMSEVKRVQELAERRTKGRSP
ncbi:MAG: hypothetical protein M3N43_04155 [Actinomycetota bacterium]|nr:hypothetical protein [Actinomycetota bacterium]